MSETASWPLILLALRAGAVVLLYVFLITAVRALHADLRLPLRSPGQTALPSRPDAPAQPRAVEQVPHLLPETAHEPDPAPPLRRRQARLAIPAAAGILVAVLGTAAFVTSGPLPWEAGNTGAGSRNPFEPPLVVPDPGRVTVGLAAIEDAQLRVTVDGVVQFDGTLPAGQRQSWEGTERIQVWTDSGQTLQLAVNGQDLGPYAPAMGHPDWNRIDYGFWPGWAP